MIHHADEAEAGSLGRSSLADDALEQLRLLPMLLMLALMMVWGGLVAYASEQLRGRRVGMGVAGKVQAEPGLHRGIVDRARRTRPSGDNPAMANRGTPPASVVVCLPDLPELVHLGDLPPNVDVRLIAPEPGPLPDLADVELIVPDSRIRAALFELLSGGGGRLRVIQTTSAGVDWLIGRVPRHVMVCNARGVFDAPLAEWVIGAILAMERGLVQSRDAQARRSWETIGAAELSGRRVVILGLGSIGTAIADRLRPFGVDVIGVGQTARGDGRGLADLDALLPGAEILVNMLPLTSRTAGLVDGRRLGLLPDGALVVNAGRGRTVDTNALVKELRAGRLRAALDVTDPEPLPPEHPLWELPNVLITPHMAGDSRGSTIRSFQLAGDQIRRFAAGEPLLNEVARYLLE